LVAAAKADAARRAAAAAAANAGARIATDKAAAQRLSASAAAVNAEAERYAARSAAESKLADQLAAKAAADKAAAEKFDREKSEADKIAAPALPVADEGDENVIEVSPDRPQGMRRASSYYAPAPRGHHSLYHRAGSTPERARYRSETRRRPPTVRRKLHTSGYRDARDYR